MHMKALLSILLFAAAAFAADANVAGRWSGSMTLLAPDGQTRDGSALLILTQSGTAVAGTAGPSEDRQLPIQAGKIDGSKLTFQVQAEDVNFSFALSLDKPDHMAGEVNGTQNGQQLKIKLDLTRAK